jgi:hypothetical protein
MTDGSSHRALLPRSKSLARGSADGGPGWGGHLPSQRQRPPMYTFAAHEESDG